MKLGPCSVLAWRTAPSFRPSCFTSLPADVLEISELGMEQSDSFNVKTHESPSPLIAAGSLVRLIVGEGTESIYLHANVRARHGDDLVLNAPDAAVSFSRLRRSDRARVTRGMLLKVPLPQPAGKTLTFEILDVSPEGVGVRVDAGQMVLPSRNAAAFGVDHRSGWQRSQEVRPGDPCIARRW